jgi:hypothetical protein
MSNGSEEMKAGNEDRLTVPTGLVSAPGLVLASCGQSEYSSCFVAPDAWSFTGAWLKHDAGERAAVETRKCDKANIRLDGVAMA